MICCGGALKIIPFFRNLADLRSPVKKPPLLHEIQNADV